MRLAAPAAYAYVFEAKLKRRTIRRIIRDVRAWSIEGARAEAHRLRVLLDGGIDPRQLDRQLDRQQEAEADEPKAAWKPRCVADLRKAAATGGEPKKRSKSDTKPGHLAALMPLPLASIDQNTIRDW